MLFSDRARGAMIAPMEKRPPLTLRTLARLPRPSTDDVGIEAALNCARHLHRAAACAHHGYEEVARPHYWQHPISPDGR